MKGVTGSLGPRQGRRPDFNPHTSEGCDNADGLAGSTRYSNFNPHTREGCDSSGLERGLDGIISIHTPVKGVTNTMVDKRRAYGISIHTPVKGVTTVVISGAPVWEISIHTPVKGVTGRSRIRNLQIFRISIHTPVKGVTGERKNDECGTVFQSTHP